MKHFGSCKRCGVISEYAFKCKIKDYCSYSCSNYSKWENKEKAKYSTINCHQCNSAFTLKTSALKAREKKGQPPKYCSQICHGKSKQKPIIIKQPKENKKGPWAKDVDLDARRLYFRNYTEKNKEKLNKASRDWAKKNRSYRNYIQQIRRASGDLTFDEWQSFLENNKICAHCGHDKNLQVDHIVPVIKGGLTELNNIQRLCKPCNISKGSSEKTKLPKDWRIMKSVHGLDIRLTK